RCDHSTSAVSPHPSPPPQAGEGASRCRRRWQTPSPACGGGLGWGRFGDRGHLLPSSPLTFLRVPMPIPPQRALRASALLLLAMLLAACSAPATGPDGNTDPPATQADVDSDAGAAITGAYPDLFAEAGYSDADIQAKIEGAFEQLFHG